MKDSAIIKLHSLSSCLALQYVGMWFTYAKYPSETVQGERCIRTQTSLNPDGQSTNLKTEQLIGVSMPMPLVYMGMSPFMPGSGIFNYTIMSRQGQTRNVPLTVLETDYTTYSVVYSCRMTGDNSNDRDLYIQTRSKDPPQESISKAYQAASNQGLDTMYLTKIDNDDCDDGSGSEESTTPESTNWYEQEW